MRIDELFDQPLPLEWKRVPGTHNTAMRPATNAFFDVDGATFKVSFTGEDPADDEDENLVSITFGLIGRNHTYNARHDSTTPFKHKTVLIFSTVAHAIDEYWKKEDPDAMYFAASSHRQEKTYNKMMKFFNTTHPEYHVELKHNNRDGEYYEITK